MPAARDARPETIAAIVKGMANPYFWPNRGNYGDLLIAEGIRDFLGRNGISYEEFLPGAPPSQPYNLIYGGGGGFVPQWIDVLETELITGPLVKQCLVLPCSVRGVDEFVHSLDARHTVLLRDRESYDYCTSLNGKAHFFMADDMALQLDMDAVRAGETTEDAASAGAADQDAAAMALAGGLAHKVLHTVRRATVVSRLHGEKRRIAFILRTDSEAAAPDLVTLMDTDVSLLYNSYCYRHKYNKKLLHILAEGLGSADAIVSDRLHVCIMSYLIGKEVYMLDNSYGKLRGVYEQALSRSPSVHYIGCKNLPQELQRAWKKWWPWYKRLMYRAAASALRLKFAIGRTTRKFRILRR